VWPLRVVSYEDLTQKHTKKQFDTLNSKVQKKKRKEKKKKKKNALDKKFSS
tara:strand:- start:1677 stop:1829 length:153 start_codon:yes stop_codon:yes gene_type:complete